MWKPRVNLIHSDSKQFWQQKKQQNKKTVVMGITKTQKFVNNGGEIMLASLCDAYMQCWKYLGSALNEKQTDYSKHYKVYPHTSHYLVVTLRLKRDILWLLNTVVMSKLSYCSIKLRVHTYSTAQK